MPVRRERRRVPVLIVVGGPVGLALAADLGWRGIDWFLPADIGCKQVLIPGEVARLTGATP